VGNLLDNALRWAQHTVKLRVAQDGDRLSLTISDDGPGMLEAECQAAMKRGSRLDEQRSGSGLGLAIVADVVALYQGDMQLGRAESGGLRVKVSLPVAAR
ncbi:ATP-binding protein, partial [Halomonas vilamensis]